jgi:hypothetical protein
MQLKKEEMLRKYLININLDQLEAEMKRITDQLQSTTFRGFAR